MEGVEEIGILYGFSTVTVHMLALPGFVHPDRSGFSVLQSGYNPFMEVYNTEYSFGNLQT
jgi:hypothetical protein